MFVIDSGADAGFLVYIDRVVEDDDIGAVALGRSDGLDDAVSTCQGDNGDGAVWNAARAGEVSGNADKSIEVKEDMSLWVLRLIGGEVKLETLPTAKTIVAAPMASAFPAVARAMRRTWRVWLVLVRVVVVTPLTAGVYVGFKVPASAVKVMVTPDCVTKLPAASWIIARTAVLVGRVG